MPPYTLLVTVGSTLFQPLTDSVLSPSILALLVSVHVSTLIVQLGRAEVPSHLGLKSIDGGEMKAVYRTEEGEVEVRVMRYTPDLMSLIKTATHVVSHAGSGTILDVLRRDPPAPLLVVPNTSLMDNHQQELAEALGKGNYLDVCLVNELETGLRRLFSDHERIPFPPPQPTFQSILDATAGFA